MSQLRSPTRQRRQYTRLRYVTPRPKIVALVHDPFKRTRLDRAACGYYELVVCRESSRLVETVLANEPAIVVVELRDAHGALCGSALAVLRAMFPALPVIISMVLEPRDIHDAFDLPRSPDTTIVLARVEDDCAGFRRVLFSAEKCARAASLFRQLRHALPRSVSPTASMSRKGDCWDNAVVESFFATLKTELVHDRRYRTREEARQDIFEYIEVWYNRKRLLPRDLLFECSGC